MNRFVLFSKGVCMGASDIIPGVSGGTMALILGIYRRLVRSISSLHLRWVPPLWRWITEGRGDEDWQTFRKELATLDLLFLATLGAGIAAAVAGGSMIIPVLMERYPVAMDAFFFGLIVASVWIPFRMIDISDASLLTGVLVIGVAAAGLGYVITSPASQTKWTQTWTAVESEGESLEDLARRGPSASPAAMVYWADENSSLRQAIESEHPQVAEELASYREQAIPEGGSIPSKDQLKKMSEPFREVQVPAGVEVQFPRPSIWFVGAAGAVAICAMILPGISGSYILLILGVYFFVLNAVKGSIEMVLDGRLPLEHGAFVGLFVVGAVAGILSFAKFLDYLLSTYTAFTLAGLVGLMVGCLRGIWPFQTQVDGRLVNHVPDALGPDVYAAAGACLVGFAIVGGLTYAGSATGGAGNDEAHSEHDRS
jgi:putative membrane protein